MSLLFCQHREWQSAQLEYPVVFGLLQVVAHTAPSGLHTRREQESDAFVLSFSYSLAARQLRPTAAVPEAGTLYDAQYQAYSERKPAQTSSKAHPLQASGRAVV